MFAVVFHITHDPGGDGAVQRHADVARHRRDRAVDRHGVDGNILILRADTRRIEPREIPVRGAVDLGFSRAFSAISNGGSTACAGLDLVLVRVRPDQRLRRDAARSRLHPPSPPTSDHPNPLRLERSRKKGHIISIWCCHGQPTAYLTTHNKFRALTPGNNFAFVAKFRIWIISIAWRPPTSPLVQQVGARRVHMNWTIDFQGGTEEIIFAFKDKVKNEFVKVSPEQVRRRSSKRWGRAGDNLRHLVGRRDNGKRRRHDHSIAVLGTQARCREERPAAPEVQDRDIGKAKWSDDRLYVRINQILIATASPANRSSPGSRPKSSRTHADAGRLAGVLDVGPSDRQYEVLDSACTRLSRRFQQAALARVTAPATPRIDRLRAEFPHHALRSGSMPTSGTPARRSRRSTMRSWSSACSRSPGPALADLRRRSDRDGALGQQYGDRVRSDSRTRRSSGQEGRTHHRHLDQRDAGAILASSTVFATTLIWNITDARPRERAAFADEHQRHRRYVSSIFWLRRST